MEKKKRREVKPSWRVPYWLLILLIVGTLGSAGFGVSAMITKDADIAQIKAENAQIRTALSELLELARISEEPTAGAFTQEGEEGHMVNVPSLRLVLEPYVMKPGEESPTAWNDVYGIMQAQYTSFSQNVTLIVSVITVIIALLTIVIPIFNYTFTTKEHVAAFQNTSDRAIVQFGKIVEEKEQKLQRALDRATQVTAAVAGDDKDAQIKTQGGDEKDRALDLSMQAKLAYSATDYAKALVLISEAIGLDSGNADFYSTRSSILRDMLHFEEALENIKHAVELDDSNELYHFNMGLLYEVLGDDKNAETCFQTELILTEKKYGQEGCSAAYSYGKLARLYQRVNDQTKAKKYAMKAYDVNVKVYGNEHEETQRMQQLLDELNNT